MDWKKIIAGMVFGAVSYAVNQPYVTIVLSLVGFVLADKENNGLDNLDFFWAFFAVLFVLYNMKLYGVLG